MSVFRVSRSPIFWALILSGMLLATFRPVAVNGPSMRPALESGDRLLVESLSPRLGLLERGDVVVFPDPRDPAHPILVKRIIGLPNETVRIADGAIFIRHPDGREEPLADEWGRGWNGADRETKLGPEDYFLMGDNRAESTDSRDWGTIQPHEMTGTPLVRLAPLSRFAWRP